jgi:tRNA (adenine57-N1/adenine58-N1)-methyltransferase catalytic subunit
MHITETKRPKHIQAGDLVQLVGKDKREYVVQMRPGREFQTHHGVLPHDDVIGRFWGETALTHMNYPYLLLPPSLDRLLRSVKRNTQIIYPKEIGYILMKMNIGPGTHVLEAGTGSGALTLAFARMVMPQGHVYTYEVREKMQALARQNHERIGLTDYITYKLRDIAEGFDEEGLDAVFLDVREPWHYLEQAHAALKGGGFFGAILPTTNQVSDLLAHLTAPRFGFVEVEELILRPYKPVHDRLRPADRIIGHTGYLIFARALTAPEESV